MNTSKNLNNTKYFKHMIEEYKSHKLSAPTSFAEIFASSINRTLLLPRKNGGVSWRGDNKGWWIQLSDYQEYLVNDYECKPLNDLCNHRTEKIINTSLSNYMKKAFGIKYSISRKKYFDLKEKTK